MHPKVKVRPVGGNMPLVTVMPALAHDVANPAASANAASRRGQVALQPAPGTANHSRHHVSRHTQS